MDEFLTQLIDEQYKPKLGKAVAKTIAETALMNLLALPFGFVGWSLNLPKRRAEMKAMLEEKRREYSAR